MAESVDQHTSGRTSPCCGGLKWALSLGYVLKGYLWYNPGAPKWIPWTLHITGRGYQDISPIHYCPFCGTDLDSPER